MIKSKRWKRRNRWRNTDLYNAFIALEKESRPFDFRIIRTTIGMGLQRNGDTWYSLVYDYKRPRGAEKW